MMVPIRCFSCGSLIAEYYEDFKKLADKKGADKALNELGFDRLCCRRMFLSTHEFIDELIKYQK